MNQPEEKIYVPRSIVREKTFERSGKTILNVVLHADTMAEFVKQHQDAKGFITLGISRTKAIGKYGQTHCMWLDTWKPTPRTDAGAYVQPARPATQPDQSPEDDVPF